MLADVGTGGGEGIVLADEADGVVTPALLDQGHIAGNVYPGGAHGHAGNRVFQTAQTAVVGDVLLIIVPKAQQSHQHQLGRVDPDGTVRRVHDDPGGLFDPVEDTQFRFAVQHLADHAGELGQTDPAGHAFAAGLRLTQVQKIQGHVDRTQTRRAGSDPPFHIAVQLFHHSLRLTGSFDIQSAHLLRSFYL